MNNRERTLREIEHALARQKQDRLFYKNEMLRQKLTGALISLLSIFAWWFLSARYGQFEWGLVLGAGIITGLYMVLTRRNWYREMKMEMETY